MSNRIFPPTEGRGFRHTFPGSNDAIAATTMERLQTLAGASKNEVHRHFGKLAMEWDMERALEANVATLGMITILLGTFYSRWWFLFTFTVVSFLLQHALTGYCPPLPIFRYFGFRTAAEIEDEMAALRLTHNLGVSSIKVSEADRRKVVQDMIRNKRETGSFVGEGPERTVDRAEALGVTSKAA